jgi:hypothetical protein
VCMRVFPRPFEKNQCCQMIAKHVLSPKYTRLNSFCHCLDATRKMFLSISQVRNSERWRNLSEVAWLLKYRANTEVFYVWPQSECSQSISFTLSLQTLLTSLSLFRKTCKHFS